MMSSIYDIGFPGSSTRPPRSTVISIVPWAISEFKPGLNPSNFFIPASVDGEPQCVLIGDCIHYVYIDHDRGSMRVTDPSYIVARSIVTDYNSAQMEANVGCHPGLFWRVGEYTPARVKTELQEELATVRNIQKAWFEAIIRVGDDDWEKTHQHYSISDFQRSAARIIDPENKRNRPWIVYTAPEGDVNTTLCPACGSDIPKSVVVCRYCRYVVDPERHAKMQFASTGGVDVNAILKGR